MQRKLSGNAADMIEIFTTKNSGPASPKARGHMLTLMRIFQST